MKIYNTQADIDAALDKAGNLYIEDDIVIRCNCVIDGDITAGDIKARNIKARDISYYAICVAHQTLTCRKIKGHREKSLHTCLDSEIVFKDGGAK